MIKAALKRKRFDFIKPAITSRNTLFHKDVSFILLYDEDRPGLPGIGEITLFPGLSKDDLPGLEKKINEIISLINQEHFNFNVPLHDWPSINFGLETALLDLKQGGSKILFPSEFTRGNDSIIINGLIWMGKKNEILVQIDEKLKKGFSCLKMKIGALNFKEEYDILKNIRENFSRNELEIRVDANGAYSMKNVFDILDDLSTLEIHSIEQPIPPSRVKDMADIVEKSPVAIALDEELLGKYNRNEKISLLDTIKPHYIVLKPGLLGGFDSCEEWISIAKQKDIGWWITSSLETNVGLNAISQWTYKMGGNMPQGLGTGTLFKENIDSPLTLLGDRMNYLPGKKWNLDFFTKKD